MTIWENTAYGTDRTKYKAVKSISWLREVQSHLRRLPLEILNLVVNYDWIFWLVGFINKRLQLIRSVFLVYPATENYALSYVYERRLSRVKWDPWPCGFIWQNGKMTIMFCISATSMDFIDSGNDHHLQFVATRLERLRNLFGAESMTFAGVLPGVLFKKRLIRQAPEADLTARAVLQALHQVIERENLPKVTPILVLGGRGFIGKRLTKLATGLNIRCIDIADDAETLCPSDVIGARCIVLNIATDTAVGSIIDWLDRGSVVINEAYPEPDVTLVQRLHYKDCSVYHIVGVEGSAYPPFPGAYRRGVPCCAAQPAREIKVIVEKL